MISSFHSKAGEASEKKEERKKKESRNGTQSAGSDGLDDGGWINGK